MRLTTLRDAMIVIVLVPAACGVLFTCATCASVPALIGVGMVAGSQERPMTTSQERLDAQKVLALTDSMRERMRERDRAWAADDRVEADRLTREIDAMGEEGMSVAHRIDERLARRSMGDDK